MECEESGFSKQGWLMAWLSREFQPRGNWTASCPILSCSAQAGVMLQLLSCLTREQLLARKSGFSKQDWLVAWLSREFQPRGNWTASCPILSCSAPASVMLQLLACLAREQLLAACSCQSPTRSSRKSQFFLHTFEHFFTLSHSLTLQESHLNTGLLIAEIQVNLARNKAKKMVDKIQPYTNEEVMFIKARQIARQIISINV